MKEKDFFKLLKDSGFIEEKLMNGNIYYRKTTKDLLFIVKCIPYRNILEIWGNNYETNKDVLYLQLDMRDCDSDYDLIERAINSYKTRSLYDACGNK